MCSNDGIVDRIVVSQLDLDALAERREHLREHDLLVPRWTASALADGSFALKYILYTLLTFTKCLLSWEKRSLLRNYVHFNAQESVAGVLIW